MGLSEKRLPVKIAWGITGSGDFMSETVQVMKKAAQRGDVKVAVFLSKSAVLVLKWYRLYKELESISPNVMIEKGPNEPFIAGPLQVGKFKFLLVAPATANTVAKIVHGIADSLVTNAVSQAQKGNVPIYILPVDQEIDAGKTTTILPTGEKLELTMREVDVENTIKLKGMRGITVLSRAQEIEDIIGRYTSSMP